MSNYSDSLIIVVDGGGSTCRAAVATPSGEVLGRATGQPANIATDVEETGKNILVTIDTAYRSAGLSSNRISNDVAYFGLAGATIGTAAKELEMSLNFKDVRVVSDRDIMVQGALGQSDGTVAQIGTGSFFVCRQGGNSRHIGGWGLQLGDEGSGAYIGRAALRKTLHANDGLIEHSPLSRQVLDHFHGSPQKIVAFAKSASPADYGQFAPQVIEARRRDDALAQQIIGTAIRDVCKALDALNTRTVGALYLLGGLGGIYQELLPSCYKSLCKMPLGDALSGAIALAQSKFFGPTK